MKLNDDSINIYERNKIKLQNNKWKRTFAAIQFISFQSYI